MVMVYWPAGVPVVCAELEGLEAPPHPEMLSMVTANRKSDVAERSERALRFRIKSVGKTRNASRVPKAACLQPFGA